MKLSQSPQSWLAYLLVAIGVVLIIFWSAFNNWPWLQVSKTSTAVSLANFQAMSGRVLVKKYSEEIWTQVMPMERGSLEALDQIQTAPDSQTILSFASSYQIKLNENARAMIELIQGTQDYFVLLHIFSGTFELLQTGKSGQLLIQMNRKRFRPEDSKGQEANLFLNPQILTLNHDKAISEEQTANDSSTTKTKTFSMKSSSEEPISKVDKLLPLSNFEMDQSLAKYQPQFEKCQLNAVRDQELSNGELLFGITLAPIGRVSEVRVLTTDIPDGAFLQCIKSVIERAEFRPFPPPEIVRSYPLVFE